MRERTTRVSRRAFLRRAAGAAATISFLPGHVLGRGDAPAPSERLDIAAIGAGGRAGANLAGVRSENIVALCDVDDRHAAKAYQSYPQAKRFHDFRKMLDDLDRSIDAVLVSTPDHTHAVACMAAIKRGKHVYCEKPLAHSIREVRAVVEAARKHKVATQLGNQGHSSGDIRKFCEWIRAGAIGEVREVHAVYGGSYGRPDLVDRVKEVHAVPATLDWDLWLGPAPRRTYNPMYLPGSWRGWYPFGTGAIGDWVCHVLDPCFWALDLGAPSSIQAETFEFDLAKYGDTFPRASTVRYEFPARAEMPAVTLSWYEGPVLRPADLGSYGKSGTGALVVGETGKIAYGSHGAGGVRIIPEEKMKAYVQPSPTIPRSKGHYRDWIEACKGGAPASSTFDYGGPLTELALLGVIAMRSKGKRLEWDANSMKFTNAPEANALLAPPFREGWTL